MPAAPRCPICHDAGVVELTGTDSDGYSRGSAPCRWCDQGKKLHDHLKAKNQYPLSDYSPHSLADPAAHSPYRVVTREEAIAQWTSCTHTWVDQGEPQARAWAGDSLQWKRCSKCGKETATHVPLEAGHHRRHNFDQPTS